MDKQGVVNTSQQAPSLQFQQPVKPNKSFWIRLLLFIALITISTGIGGYLLGKNNNVPAKVSELSKNVPAQIITQESKPTQPPTLNDKWGTFSQEFIRGYEYKIKYPLNGKSDPSILNGKDSGWPISQLEQQFSVLVQFGDNYLGLADQDPTDCYKTTCKGTLETITKSEVATVSGILSKRVEGTAYGGGGVLPLGGPPKIVLYVIPYLKKFFILYPYQNENEEFKTFLSSFQVHDF